MNAAPVLGDDVPEPLTLVRWVLKCPPAVTESQEIKTLRRRLKYAMH